jgi:hypothetical protein
MEETALPRRSSTLPPPPLANGASATRALQRFDLGRLRSVNRLAPATPPEPIEPLVRTTRMSVPTRVTALVSTARMSVPASIRFLEPQAQAVAAVAAAVAAVAVVDAKGVVQRVAPIDAAAWAVAASASLVGAGSLVTVLVYALLFP